MFVTTSIQPTPEQVEEAKRLARKLQVPYRYRRRDSVRKLLDRVKESEVLIVTKSEWRYQHRNGHTFFFHPNMSALRIKHIADGKPDPLVEVASLRTGDVVLDCTLGMGADSIVASYVVGESGRVIAIESQPVIAAIVEQGFQTYQSDRKRLVDAMRRIEVRLGSYQELLPNFPDQSVDVVMFDPMFRETVKESQAMQALKPLANPSPLDEASVQEAKRVARRSVLLKERPNSGEFERLGFEIAKVSSQYAWGIWRR